MSEAESDVGCDCMHAEHASVFREADGMREGQRPGNKPAQGNALGCRFNKDKSPERAAQIVTPFQGFVCFGVMTQGVALGWLVGAPLVLVAASVRFYIRSSGTGGAA